MVWQELQQEAAEVLRRRAQEGSTLVAVWVLTWVEQPAVPSA